jgi:hypothetical protein
VIVASPYQCEELQELNQSAAELMEQLNIPMPPMVNNLMGLRVKMDNFNPNGQIPQGDGLVAIHVDKPEMFVGMASMMVPGFDGLDLPNQSEPVKIPAEMLHMEDLDVFALMTDNAIGAAVGEQHASDLVKFMAAKPQDSGTFFSISYDMAKQMEIQMAMEETFAVNPDSPADELAAAVMESYTTMFGRYNIAMRFTGDGLVIDSTMTFK